MMTTDPELPRTWHRPLTAVALVGAVLLVVWGVKRHLRSAGEHEFAAVAAQLDADEPGWRLAAVMAQYNASLPPPERNSAHVVLKAYDLIPQRWRNLDASRVPALKPAPNYLPQQKRADVLAELRAPTAAARELALTLIDMPDGGFAYEWKPDPTAMDWPFEKQFRTVANLLSHEASLRLLDGDADGAVAATRACLNAARSLGRVPHLHAQAWRTAAGGTARFSAMGVLAAGQPTKGLAELQAAFAREADENWLIHTLHGERGFIEALVTAVESGQATPGKVDLNVVAGSSRQRNVPQLYRDTSPGDRAECVRVLTESIAAVRLPWHEQLAAIDRVRLAESRGPADMRQALIDFADIRNEVRRQLTTRADMLAASAGIACERFRIKTGRWPASLAEIPADILPAVPLDPFDAKPLTLSPEPDGLAVCVGWHDGSNRPDRAAFRLWNPDQRHRPPAE